LYEHVVKEAAEPEPPLSESGFIDTIYRNLRSGRFLLLIVGDGIREEAEAMTEFLQQHAGAHFALALVALEVYEVPASGQRLLVPSVPLTTTNIVRGIVRIEEGGVAVTAPPSDAVPARATTLTDDEFFAEIEKLRPGAAIALRSFLDAQEDLHIDYEVRKTLIVRMSVGDLKFSPFVIMQNGIVETGWTSGHKELAKPYSVCLAAAIPGAALKETPKTWYVLRRKSDGTFFTALDLIDHAAACRRALEVLYDAMTALAESRQRD
jgi:hypothetical protein